MSNFVIFSLSRWNIEFGCNIKDISLELSKTNKVLYIDVPLKRKERWFKKSLPAVKEVEDRLKHGQSIVKINNNLWHYIGNEVLEPVNGISHAGLFDFVNRINNKRFACSIKKAIQLIGFKDYILLNDNDIFNGIYLKELLKPSVYVYYIRDQLAAMVYWKRQVTRLEPLLIKDVDLVVANSEYLKDYAKHWNPKSYYIGQGCDLDLFLKVPDEKEVSLAMGDIQRPIIGYIGALNTERLDIHLLYELAVRLKNCNFVLVGQEDAGFMKSNLHSLTNVHFLGRKDFSVLPHFLHGFDVAINPQAMNEVTIGNYPRKVDEYLAAGKPVVATKTHAMKPFERCVYLAEDTSTFAALIQKALEENNLNLADERKKFAAEHTWQNSVIDLLKAIETGHYEWKN